MRFSEIRDGLGTTSPAARSRSTRGEAEAGPCRLAAIQQLLSITGAGESSKGLAMLLWKVRTEGFTFQEISPSSVSGSAGFTM